MSGERERLKLKNCVSEELAEKLAWAGIGLRAARQLQASSIRRDDYPDARSGLSSKVLTRLRELTEIPRLEVVDKVVSPVDAFARYVFKGDGGDRFEAVRIPLLHRPEDRKYVVCVSSQVGCPLGCAFCFTGRAGFKRNLAVWEIVDQACRIQADSEHPVRGIVFMGMGEPMLNYYAVIEAARIFSEPCGMAISRKAITISTAGIVPAIRRFTSERRPYQLIFSLTSADPARRQELMPVEKVHPTPQLMEAIREYHAMSRRRITLAWTMMAGVNTSAEDVRLLAALTRGLPITLNLIDVNDPTGRFRPPSDEELSAFRDALRQEVGMPVVRRYSGGQDIRAACGMLAGQ
jgi:23S rRNA (adenine2503-C2)-methyltransferase